MLFDHDQSFNKMIADLPKPLYKKGINKNEKKD